ncbi:MAG: glycoside hydrolase family 3 C-terminal domain-containing protein [Clostridia bacterium]|nr:glycoside hydrolase family 3 C-terminal domain-containing protein [Clostridia bacterium]
MTLAEKMGQVVCFWPRLLPDDEKVFAENYPCGAGVLAAVYMRMLPTRAESVAFQRKWQKLAMDVSPHHIPALFHIEGLCGPTIQDALSYPGGIGRAASFDADLEKSIGETIGRQAAVMGVGHVFAPVLDISRDPRNGRMFETYGEDPTLAAAMGTAYAQGIQAQHDTPIRPEAVAKHFLGFHGSQGGIQSSAFEVSERTLREVYAKPFQACITEAGLGGVMPCYTPVNGEGVSASGKLLTSLLRDEMGFEGLAVSDYTGISKLYERNHLYESLEDAGYAAMNAGMDVETALKKAYSNRLEEQFAAGERDMAILDRAVLRVLETKFRMGLFEHPFAMDAEDSASMFLMPGDVETAKKSAEESLVLLRNNGVLPLSDSVRSIAVIGCHAQTARYMFGGYTHYSMAEGNIARQLESDKQAAGKTPETIPGTPVLRSDEPEYEELLRLQKPGCRNLLDELRRRYPCKEILYAYGYDCAGTDESHFEEAIETARKADLVIMTLGGKNGTRKTATMGEGTDASNINLPAVQDKLIRLMQQIGKPVVGVHFDGRPVSSNAADGMDALLEAWSPAEFGSEAIVGVLSGDLNPSGKLPVSVVYNAGQIPLCYSAMNGSSFTPYTSIGVMGSYVDCPHEPRYPFGYGLSYTQFEYSQLSAKAEPEGVRIQAQVTNSGSRAGTEIVQLYVADDYASVLRPVRELAGFARVSLKPGETACISFLVHYGQLAFYRSEGTFIAEKGDFRIEVGASSADIRLQDTFHLEKDMVFSGRNRGFFAETEIRQAQ